MLFTQNEFFVFFVIVYGFLFMVKNHRVRKLFLLGASYYFYAYWDWRFLSLVIISTFVDYFVSRALERSESPRTRKNLLLISLLCNLGLLGFFKYFNFFIDSMQVILEPLGFHTGTLNIILPIGISFYTFQTLSYTIDVYRKQIKVCHDFFDFALFVGFFPQLVAGPIVRASEFLPQLDRPIQLSWKRSFEGFRQFTFGMVKKLFIADRLAFFIDHSFNDVSVLDGMTMWLAILAYSVQIYCDFSGYSDMAIGLARSIGFDFKENFNHPYIAKNITDFWRRWHISLSSWLKDYLYIPLGGNRKGLRRTYINLMLTMLLGGLWHGAAWTFVLWGGIHGVSLAVHKWMNSNFNLAPPKGLEKFYILLSWLFTQLVVIVAWVPFRAGSFENALIILKKLFWDWSGFSWHPPFALFGILIIALTELIHACGKTHWIEFPENKWYTPVFLFTLVWLIIIFHPTVFEPFIYFQF